ncbi:MAG: ABC transporter permease [Dehalococcoidia bacterium]
MTKYILRRLLATVPVIILVTMLLFGLREATPGDPATVAVGQETELNREEYQETLRRMRERFDLDKPLPVQYVLWLGKALTGDLGRSYRSNQPVSEAILERLPVTLELGLASLLLSWVIAIPAGVIAAKNRNKAQDVAANFVGLLGLSMPNIWLAFVLILIFSVHLGWLPPSGYVPFSQDPIANIKSLILPAVTLGTAAAAGLMRLTRSSLLEVIGQDYMRTAQAKGLRSRAILWRHGMRNALIPVITVIGLELGGLLGGAFIMEQIFSLPGMGKLAVDAIYSRDYPIVQGVLLLATLMYLLANLIVDLTYGLLDPRIRYE